MISFVFNEVVGLRVHTQQEYKLIVDHEPVDVLGWQWSLHAMVLHIGATKNEGHFVVYVVLDNKWWLCDHTTGKGTMPPRSSRKGTFLLYKRPGMSQATSQRTRASALGNKGDAQSMPTDISVPAMALSPGASPPSPHMQQRVHQGLGTGTGIRMPTSCLLPPLYQQWRCHHVHPPPPHMLHRVHQGWGQEPEYACPERAC